MMALMEEPVVPWVIPVAIAWEFTIFGESKCKSMPSAHCIHMADATALAYSYSCR